MRLSNSLNTRNTVNSGGVPTTNSTGISQGKIRSSSKKTTTTDSIMHNRENTHKVPSFSEVTTTKNIGQSGGVGGSAKPNSLSRVNHDY